MWFDYLFLFASLSYSQDVFPETQERTGKSFVSNYFSSFDLFCTLIMIPIFSVCCRCGFRTEGPNGVARKRWKALTSRWTKTFPWPLYSRVQRSNSHRACPLTPGSLCRIPTRRVYKHFRVYSLTRTRRAWVPPTSHISRLDRTQFPSLSVPRSLLWAHLLLVRAAHPTDTYPSPMWVPRERTAPVWTSGAPASCRWEWKPKNIWNIWDEPWLDLVDNEMCLVTSLFERASFTLILGLFHLARPSLVSNPLFDLADITPFLLWGATELVNSRKGVYGYVKLDRPTVGTEMVWCFTHLYEAEQLSKAFKNILNGPVLNHADSHFYIFKNLSDLFFFSFLFKWSEVEQCTALVCCWQIQNQIQGCFT